MSLSHFSLRALETNTFDDVFQNVLKTDGTSMPFKWIHLAIFFITLYSVHEIFMDFLLSKSDF